MTPLQNTQKKPNIQLEKAYKQYENALLKYAFLRIHSTYLSEDIVQDTFLRTWKYIAEGGEIYSMKAFLYHILKGLIIDQYRKEGREAFSLEALMEIGFDRQTNEHLFAGQVIDTDLMASYIARLPPKSRKIMYMKMTLGMTISEISLELHETKNSVSVQIHRGIKALKILHYKKSQGQIS